MGSLLFRIHEAAGDVPFVIFLVIVGLFISLRIIPLTTGMMVNSAAGLAGKHLGKQYRTLVMNCSTNNPEFVTMMLALLLGGKQGIGGIGTPLGSNFANIYLIFFVAIVWLLGSLWFRDRSQFHRLLVLLGKEWKLVAWHLAMSIGMFLIAGFAFRLLTGQFPIGTAATHPTTPSSRNIAIAAVACAVGVAIFVWRERYLRAARSELFDDIDDSDHIASWMRLAAGTLGLMIACYVVNEMFVVSTKLYSTVLAQVLGPSVFAAMHYFLGALITSLPELNVAIYNYRKLTSADLNTGLSSASTSNMSNLAVAGIGAAVALLLVG